MTVPMRKVPRHEWRKVKPGLYVCDACGSTARNLRGGNTGERSKCWRPK